MDIDTKYDVASLVSTAKANLCKFVAKIVIFSILLILSILAIIFYGSYMLVFIGSIILGCISVFFCSKLIKNFAFSDYTTASGEIVDVLKESTTVRSITGGYGMYVTRKYDAFAKAAIRLTVSIKSNDEIHSYILDGVTEEHEKYYAQKGDAEHIWGTHFPVKLEIGKEQWLCPVCGEFNVNEKKTCARCKRKILK